MLAIGIDKKFDVIYKQFRLHEYRKGKHKIY